MIIKLRSERRGAHVHERVFVGPDVDHLALAGVLVFDIGQWQTFGAAIGLGVTRMHGQVMVLYEGDAEVVAVPARTPITEDGGSPMELEE